MDTQTKVRLVKKAIQQNEAGTKAMQAIDTGDFWGGVAYLELDKANQGRALELVVRYFGFCL